MKLSSKLFTYIKADQEFVVDISDLKCSAQNIFEPLLDNRLYTVGITLVSEKTGAEVDYYVVDDVRSNNGQEIYCWRLLPTTKSVQQVPDCSGTKVRIFND